MAYMDTKKGILPVLPKWIASVYVILAIITMPWTIYLAITLPTHHLTPHWDVSWVGLDIGMSILLLLNALFVYLESKWLVMSTTATTTLLILDAWFDVTTARGAQELLQALTLAVIVELPLALITFMVASHLVQREHLKTAAVELKSKLKE